MFERFTSQARRVVVMAQEHSRLLGHNWIGTEHLLLGLLAIEDGSVAPALAPLGITVDAAAEKVRAAVGPRDQVPSAHIPFSPRAKRVLDRSLAAAQNLQQQHISEAHLFAALVAVPDGLGARVLVDLGADLEQLARTAEQLARGSNPDGPAPRAGR